MNGWRLVAPLTLAVGGITSLGFAQDSIVTGKAPTQAPRTISKPITGAKKNAAAPPAQPALGQPALGQPALGQPSLGQPAAPVGNSDVRAAQEMASIATREATCLREAAMQVSLAAQKLSAATPELASKRREELAFAVGVMDECRNIARKREQDAAVGPFAEPPPEEAPPSPAALFRFGAIRVESGAADAHAVARPLRKHADRFARCYAASGGGKDNVRLRVRMVQGKDGSAKPSSVAIPGATQGDSALHRCLAGALMNTRFPQSLVGSDVSMVMGFAKPR
jgi:hypothetical protein